VEGLTCFPGPYWWQKILVIARLGLFLSKSLYKLKLEIANKLPTQSEPSVHSSLLQLEHPRGVVGDVQCPPSILFSFWAIFFDFDLRARHSGSSELLLFFLNWTFCLYPIFSFSLHIALGVQVFLLQNSQTQTLIFFIL
jgi:nitrate reductase NapE component